MRKTIAMAILAAVFAAPVFAGGSVTTSGYLGAVGGGIQGGSYAGSGSDTSSLGTGIAVSAGFAYGSNTTSLRGSVDGDGFKLKGKSTSKAGHAGLNASRGWAHSSGSNVGEAAGDFVGGGGVIVRGHSVEFCHYRCGD